MIIKKKKILCSHEGNFMPLGIETCPEAAVILS